MDIFRVDVGLSRLAVVERRRIISSLNGGGQCEPFTDRFSSDPPFLRDSFLPVFPFNQAVVTINSVSLTIIFASSVIVADGGTVISIPQAINLVNAPQRKTAGAMPSVRPHGEMGPDAGKHSVIGGGGFYPR